MLKGLPLRTSYINMPIKGGSLGLNEKKCKKTCRCQKYFVPLHSLFERKVSV